MQFNMKNNSYKRQSRRSGRGNLKQMTEERNLQKFYDALKKSKETIASKITENLKDRSTTFDER